MWIFLLGQKHVYRKKVIFLNDQKLDRKCDYISQLKKRESKLSPRRSNMHQMEGKIVECIVENVDYRVINQLN